MNIKYRFFLIITALIQFYAFSSYTVLTKSANTSAETPVYRLSPTDSINPSYQWLRLKLDSIYSTKRDLRKFNGCVLVAKNGKPVFTGAYGYANIYTKDTLHTNSSFQLASVSKTLTATAILMMKERGILTLEDNVQMYFPGFPYPDVTIKDLLSHRSGLPNYLSFCNSYWKEKDMLLTNWHVMNIMETYKPKAIGKPNSFFSYSNTNYVVLASIIEKISGLSYKDFMQMNIFQPLGMHNSWVFDHTYTTHPNLTYGFNKKGEIDQFTMFDGVVGDKGIFSSVEDLYIFDQALYSGILINEQTQNEAYTPLSFEKPSRKNYGLGWRMMQQPDNSYLTYHNGWWHSYHTLFHRHRQSNTTIIVLSNIHDRIAYDVNDVYSVVYGLDVLLEDDE
ncbi:MAG: beta-lactamase family protein [Bacteroidia bacterium]|nr:beta-lactamase family protein [Bacteroidia bacterium]